MNQVQLLDFHQNDYMVLKSVLIFQNIATNNAAIKKLLKVYYLDFCLLQLLFMKTSSKTFLTFLIINILCDQFT